MATGPTTDSNSSRLGDITLLPHQLEGARRLRTTIERHGGALLADEVGLGKTFTALHVARDARRVLVVAPASLRTMWEDACLRTRRSATITSYERVSASSRPQGSQWDLVILDEAHHARSPATKRYAALCELTRGARVLLLSATPIHNRLADLQSLFALFLGASAERLESAALSALIVRRREHDLDQRLPSLDALLRHPVPHADGVLPAIRALPPPLPPADGGTAHALVRLQLTRAWCSSDAALLAAIRNRLSTATALEHALAAGRLPSRRDLSAWSAGSDGSVQLAFAELFAAPSEGDEASKPLAIVREHAESLRRLRALVRGAAARDGARMAALARVLDARAGQQAIVFTHSTATAELAFRFLRDAHRVALLTGRGACIASGPIPRADVLRQFAPHGKESPLGTRPRSTGARRDREASPGLLPIIAEHLDERIARSASPNDVARIDVLVASDVVSEGVDLQRAAVVVHLDLPWTVARLEQRIGRVRRLGSSHTRVESHLITPPVGAEELQLTLAHLSRKATLSGGTVGRSSILGDSHVWDGILPETPAIAPATVRRALVGALRSLESLAMSTLERTPLERTPLERTPLERTPLERTPLQRTALERTALERTRSELTHSERTRSELLRSECTQSERAPPVLLRWRRPANASPRVLALVALDGEPHLVCARDNEVLLDPAAVLAELNAAVAFARPREPPMSDTREPLTRDTNEPPTPDTSEPSTPSTSEPAAPSTSEPPAPDTRVPTARALESLVRDWCAERAAAGLLSLPDASNSPSHRRLLHAIDRVAASAPRIRRAQVATAAARARALVGAQRGAGSERLLAILADSALPPRSTVEESLGWLARIENSLQRATASSSRNSSASAPSRDAILLGMLTILPVEESG